MYGVSAAPSFYEFFFFGFSEERALACIGVAERSKRSLQYNAPSGGAVKPTPCKPTMRPTFTVTLLLLAFAGNAKSRAAGMRGRMYRGVSSLSVFADGSRQSKE